MRIISVFILLLFLSNCKTHHNKAEKLRNNLIQTIKKDYHLNHGDIIAKYDLAGINQGKCLLTKNYSNVINEESYNSLFLSKFKNRNKDLKILNISASKKTAQMINLLLRLHNKYNHLSNNDLNFIKSLKEYKFLQRNKIKGESNISSKSGFEDIAKLDHLIDQMPLLLPQNNIKITSHYGMRKHPIKKVKKLHCGIDLVGKRSAPIYSSATGVVTKIGKQKGYGNIIEISHKHNFTTKYAHLKSILVNVDEHIIQGQKIGLQGNTGKTTAEHLHFEILLKNRPIDPYDFISHMCNC